ncbi:hypothetical protein ACFVH6_05170 [Spirillospora sp. NPDC127200]
MSHRPTSGSGDERTAAVGDARSIKRHRRLRTAAVVLGAALNTAIRIITGI